MNLLDFFDRAYIINLPDRTDRRREMEREVRRADVGLRPGQIAEQVQFFPGIRPTEAAPFPLIGRKGASLSFLAVLKDARDRGLSRFLVLQDDAKFSRGFLTRASSVLAQLGEREWGIVQFGYAGGPVGARGEVPRLVEFAGEVTGAHCVGVDGRCLERLIALLELQHRGVSGDDLRGPMPVDGTINVFRWLHPDVPRFLVVPSLVSQRSSRSDIMPARMDRVSVLQPLIAFLRAVRAGRWRD